MEQHEPKDDSLSEIDPAVVATVLAHADEYKALQNNIQTVLDWGEKRLQELETETIESGGTAQDFKEVAEEVKLVVAKQLFEIERDVRERYSLS